MRILFLPQKKISVSPDTYPSNAIQGQAPEFPLKCLFLIYHIKYADLYEPILASDPPTIRVFLTLEYPHPSCGFNKRPFGESFDGTTCCMPSQK